MAEVTQNPNGYSKKMGFVYIFNLVIGVGCLTLPKAFASAGLLLGVLFIIFMAFFAFIAMTYMVEAQACANALTSINVGAEQNRPLVSEEDKECEKYFSLADPDPTCAEAAKSSALDEYAESTGYSLFAIMRRVEMGQMADLFLGRMGGFAFYFVLVVFLFGDMMIYAVSVPRSVVNVTGEPWGKLEHPYQMFVAIFAIVTVPFCFFNLQKTKYLQMFTLVTRNVAFVAMIVIAFVHIGQGKGANLSDLKLFDASGIPYIYGATAFSFMCHHTLPSIITPITNKSKLTWMFVIDIFAIFSAYVLLCFSAVFAFGTETNPTCSNSPGPACQLQDLYTLNFASNSSRVLALYLQLYPAFTLTTNYPMIAITLRNNLQNLFATVFDVTKNGYDKKWWYNIPFSLVASLPPICFAFGIRNVELLVRVTGSFPGIAIQWIFPSLLVYFGRKKIINELKHKVNVHRSPFGNFFVWLLIGVSAAGFALNIYSLVKDDDVLVEV